ncbi:hypothetical protein CF327_g4881 [Tilletia walkeri]|nr:hypothetical protein CF327_g4881 [Tilletia walkeri]
MEVIKAASSILVLDPSASPGDVKSKQRLEALIRLIIGNDYETGTSQNGGGFEDLSPAERKEDKAEERQDDQEFASSFQVSVAASHPATGTDDNNLKAGHIHSRTPWHISNRYYDADVEFVAISLPLTRWTATRPPSSVDSETTNGSEDQVVAALRKALEGVPAVILALSESQSEQVHRTLLDRISKVQDAFDLEVSLVINVGAPLSPEAATASSRPQSHVTEDLTELYAEQGWEYIDLMALEEDDDEDSNEGRLESVQAGEAEVTGIDRVRQALFANTWPNLRRNDERRREDIGGNLPSEPSRQRQQPEFVGFSDSQQAGQKNDDDDGILDDASGLAYVERLQERLQEATEGGSHSGYGQMATAEADEDPDNFGAFQEAAPTSSTDPASSLSLEAWLNDDINGTTTLATGSQDDFASRFGPVPDAQAFFSSDDQLPSSSFPAFPQPGADEDDDADIWDEEDKAILAALTPSQVEVDQLRSQLSRLAPGADLEDVTEEAERQADERSGGGGGGGGGGIEALFSQMSSLKSAMDVHAARIQAIKDPVLKRKEAVKVSLAYTQMLMGGDYDAGGELIMEEEERGEGPSNGAQTQGNS